MKMTVPDEEEMRRRLPVIDTEKGRLEREKNKNMIREIMERSKDDGRMAWEVGNHPDSENIKNNKR